MLGLLGETGGGRRGGAARTARLYAFFASEAARVADRILVAHGLDAVDQRHVEYCRHEACADALNLVRRRLERLAGAALRQRRACRRLGGGPELGQGAAA